MVLVVGKIVLDNKHHHLYGVDSKQFLSLYKPLAWEIPTRERKD